jgi:hypothetical protein
MPTFLNQADRQFNMVISATRIRWQHRTALHLASKAFSMLKKRKTRALDPRDDTLGLIAMRTVG